MDWSEGLQTILTFVGVIIGSGLIQFLITRKDDKNNQFEQIRQELKDGLEEREETGKTRFEKHEEAVQKLEEAILQLTKNDTEQSRYMKCIGDELMGLAHDKLVSLTDYYQERGAITLKEKATLDAIYEPYHDGLGGNGDGEQGYNYAMQLPVVTDSKAREMDIALQKKKYCIN